MKTTVLMSSRLAGSGAVGFHCDQRSPGLEQRGRAGQDVAADRVEDQVSPAGRVLEALGVQRDVAVGAQLHDQRPGVAAPGPDHLGAGPAGQLDRHRPDRAARAVDDHRLPLGQLSVVEQGLPRRQAGPRHRRGVDMVDGRGFRATLRASTATYSAAAPSRSWSVSPYTSSPTASPAVPNPSAATTPDTSWPGMTEVRG